MNEHRWNCHACADINIGTKCIRCSQVNEFNSPAYMQLVRLGCGVRYYLGASFRLGQPLDVFTVSIIRCFGGEALTQTHKVNLADWSPEELIERTCQWALKRPGHLRIDHEVKSRE